MRGIILEGITGSGKTLLLRKLQAVLARVHRGPVWVATEHITERVLEPLKTADPEETSSHLRSHLHQLGQMLRWEQDAPQSVDTQGVYVLERFHLSCALHVPGFEQEDRWRGYDRELKVLNASLVWCRVSPERILEQSVRDPLFRRGSAWKRFVESLGGSEEKIACHFDQEQRRLQGLIGQSELPVTTVVVSADNVGRIARSLVKRLIFLT